MYKNARMCLYKYYTKTSSSLAISKRNLFSLRTNKEYHGRKLVGFTCEQMFDVIADVDSYHNFLPFCKKSTVLTRTDKSIKAALIIGFPPITESYISSVQLEKPYFVKVDCDEGKLLKHLFTTWKFTPGLESNPKSCIIDFYTNFEFKSALYSNIVNIVFDKLVHQMEYAFISEAKQRYGKPSLASQILYVKKTY